LLFNDKRKNLKWRLNPKWLRKLFFCNFNEQVVLNHKARCFCLCSIQGSSMIHRRSIHRKVDSLQSRFIAGLIHCRVYSLLGRFITGSIHFKLGWGGCTAHAYDSFSGLRNITIRGGFYKNPPRRTGTSSRRLSARTK
jgi:hypothetical protein